MGVKVLMKVKVLTREGADEGEGARSVGADECEWMGHGSKGADESEGADT